MSKYYIQDKGEQEGPFTIEELKSKKITKETPIWYEGIENWTNAGKLEELKAILTSTPPPFEKKTSPPPITQKTNEIPKKKKKLSVWNKIRIVLGIILVIIIAIVILNTINNNSSTDDNPQTIIEMEQEMPSLYLNATGNYNENFWDDKLSIEGTISNTATQANFKDIKIQVTYYTQTETKISSENYIIYKYCPAGKTIEFELKVDRPKTCKKLGWEAIDATPY